MKKDIKDSLIDILQDIKEIQFAYLFGSYAKNQETKRSDIDIDTLSKLDEIELYLGHIKKI
jgi:predicted nucleotidyltransferase